MITAALDLGPSYEGFAGHGVHGTFTANHTEGHIWKGTFVSDDGTRVRTNVTLAIGGHVKNAGDHAAALDTGDFVSVYPPGSPEVFLVVVLFLAVLGFLLFWARDVIRHRRKRSSRAKPRTHQRAPKARS